MPQADLRRCFIGWSGPSSTPLPTPAGGALVWAPPRPLWTVGDWRPHERRVIADGRTRVAFLGSCLATDEELHHALRTARAASRIEMLRELPGSFGVVVDDGYQTHVLTDHAGLHPVFHTHVGTGTMYASDAMILAALHHPNLAAAVNPFVLATKLFLPGLPEVDEPASVFQRVQRAGPDHLLTVPTDGKDRTLRLPAITGPSDPDQAAQRLLDALLTAVYGRLRHAHHVSADLSGGLDSSALTVLAAHAGSQPLAVTYADPYAVNDEDVHFASNVAAEVKLGRHAITTGDENTLPFSAMETVPLTDEPSLDALIIARTRFRLAPALAHRSDLHLAGDGGDVVLAGTGLTYLADLARTRRRRALRHEADGWARLRHHPGRQVRLAARRQARASWIDTLRGLADQLVDPHLAMPAQRSLADHLAWAALSPAAAWGTLRTRRAIAGRLHAASPDGPNPRPDSADGACLRALRWHGTATRSFGQITRTLGLTVATPYFDHQVIDACLPVPAVDRTTVNQAKPLLAAAVGDLLPPGLLSRRTKGDYTACEYYGLRTNVAQLRALLAAPRLADLDILTPTGPRDALRCGVAGMPTPIGALGAVLATESWLRALDSIDPTGWWAPTTPDRPHEEESAP
jgi:asparagine synthase (glutamine-hydrolysing)